MDAAVKLAWPSIPSQSVQHALRINHLYLVTERKLTLAYKATEDLYKYVT